MKQKNNQKQMEQITTADPLQEMPKLLLDWYDRGRRILPWREEPTPYHVWLSEIMLQQTRVEAVKPYYDRFLKALPDIKSLAEAGEEELLKLWEGLGYYNRVRNLQKAAQIIQEQYNGNMPDTYEELLKLPGIGSYTAGAVASIAYGQCVPAVDGNVLRVLSRLSQDDRDILDQKVKKSVEERMRSLMPEARSGDMNQAMMELGAMVCIPNGIAKCEECPLQEICGAKAAGTVMDFPRKRSKKPRTVEKKTVLLIQDENKTAIRRRPEKGLLAGLYEFPTMEGFKTEEEVLAYLKEIGLQSVRIQELEPAKHIFTHKEWHMIGYVIRVDELEQLERSGDGKQFLFLEPGETEERYPMPSAFATYTKYLHIRLGNDKYKE
ncbi:MAG: A/G-specific adenine glycosylase [Lachnospiraceae bacterium]|nr:A/G-specific adenine glycosylase [Lachnospiraceae bacterium]